MPVRFRLPWHSFHIHSAMSVPEARAAMARHVREGRASAWGRFAGQDALPFRGELKDNGFEVERTLGYRNSFQPLIQGTILARGAECTISVSMRLSLPVMLFAMLWSTGMAMAAFAGVHVAITRGAWFGLLPFGMLMFMVAMVTGGFGTEADTAERLLRDIFVSAPRR